jgi:hypothetical protein
MSLAGAGALITSIFGAGNSQSGSSTSKGTSSSEGLTKNSSSTVNHGRSVSNTVDSGKSTSDTGTATKSNASTTQSATAGGTQTTVGTADAGALATAKGLTSTALKDSTDQSKVQDLIQSTVHQAAINFAPTLAAGTAGAGLYNSSTTSMLSGVAQGQAASDAASAVLNYQQGEQNIASGANANVLNATKGSTGTTTNTSTGVSDTGTTANQQQDTNTTNSSDSKTGQVSQSGSVIDNIINSLTRGGSSATTSNSASGDSGGVASGLSVVCGEMKRIGKMDNKLWAIVTNHFLYCTTTLQKKAYWSWAEPFVDYMKKYPDSKFVKAICWLTHERAVYIAWKFKGEHGLEYWKYSWKGPIAYWSIAGISTIIGTFTVLPGHIWDKLSSKKWKEFDDFDRSIP